MVWMAWRFLTNNKTKDYPVFGILVFIVGIIHWLNIQMMAGEVFWFLMSLYYGQYEA